MSRKKQVYEKITALYCRISLDDGGDNESMSISNQKLMLRDFAEKHGMFQYESYVDDGYTCLLYTSLPKNKPRNISRVHYLLREDLMKLDKLSNEVRPVSYTHLDVYKRQV